MEPLRTLPQQILATLDCQQGQIRFQMEGTRVIAFKMLQGKPPIKCSVDLPSSVVPIDVSQNPERHLKWLVEHHFVPSIKSGVVSFERRTENFTSPHQLKSEKEYLKLLEDAEKDKIHSQIVDILEKLGQVYFLKKEFLVACKMWNAAFAINETYTQDAKFQEILFEDLSKAENAFVSQLNNKNLPFSYNKNLDKCIGYRDHLSKLRKNIANEIWNGSSEQMPEILKTITSSFVQLTSEMITDCIRQLGSPPCLYTIVSMGSMSRQEASLFSDLEFAILIDKDSPNHREYFRKLTRLLHLKVINLGETNFPILNHGLESPSVTGFCFDSGGNTPLGKEGLFELIGTPEQLAEFVTPLWFEQDVIISNAMSNLGFITGDRKLLQTYEEKVKVNLDSTISEKGKNLLAREQRALSLIRGDIQEFKPNLDEQKEQSKVFDIKKELYRLPNSTLNALAIFYGLQAKNSWARLQELYERGVINKEAQENFGNLLKEIVYFRVKTHLHYRSENEKVFYKPQSDYELYQWKAGNYFVLDDDDLKRIQCAFQVILPIHRKAIEFCNSLGAIQPFKEGTLKDDDLLSQASACIYVHQFDKAKELYMQALALDPTNLKAILILAKLLSVLSHKIEAVGYIKKELAELDRKGYFDEALLKEHPESAETLITILELLGTTLSSSDPEEALAHLEKARSLLKLYLPENTVLLAGILVGISTPLIHLKQLDKAIEVLEEVQNLHHNNPSSNGDTLPAFGSAIHNLGCIFMKQGLHDKAIDCLSQSVQLGEHSLYIKGIRLLSLGLALAEKGEIQKGISKMREALDCQEQLFGKVNADVATTLSYLGKWYKRLEDYKNALFYFEQELHVNQSLCGSWDKSNIVRWDRLADISISNNNLEQSLVFYRSTLEVTIRCYGKNAKELVNTYTDICQIELKLKRVEDAIKSGEKALAIIEQTQGGKYNKNYMNVLDKFSLELMHYDSKKAVSMMEEALSICGKINGTSSESYGHLLMNMGVIFRTMGNKEQAISQYKQAYDVLLPIYGESHGVILRIEEILEKLSPGSMPNVTSNYHSLESMADLAKRLLESQGMSAQVDGIDIKTISLIGSRNIPAAITNLEEQIEKEPHNIKAFMKLAGLYEGEETWDLAKSTYAKLLFHHPQYSDGYYQISLVYDHLEEKDIARLMAKKCLEIDPSHAKAQQLLEKIGKPESYLTIEICDANTVLETLRKQAIRATPTPDFFYQLRQIIVNKTGNIQDLCPFDVNLTDEKGLSLLHLAAEAGHFEAAAFLVEKGANVNLCTKDGIPPIHALCISGEKAIFDLLVNKGARLDFKAKNSKNTLLHEYAKNGRLELVKAVVERKVVPIDTENSNGFTPLHLAVMEDHDTTVSYLTAQGADVNAPTNEGIPPLMSASFKGNCKIIEILAKNNARPITKQDNALFVAITNNKNEAAKILVGHYPELIRSTNTDGMKPQTYAVLCGNHEVLPFLFNKGLNPKERYKDTDTFTIAISEGHLDCLKALYPYLNENEILMCLFCSVEFKQDASFDWLLPQITKNLDTLNFPGEDSSKPTILPFVAGIGTPHMVDTLLKNGVNHLLEHEGKNILFLAIRNGNTDVVRFLLGIQLFSIHDCEKNENQFSPLMSAVINSYSEMAKLLVDAGGDINQAFRKEKITPVHFAVFKKDLETLKALLSTSQPFKNSKTAKGASALDIAIESNQTEMCRCLCEKLGIAYLEEGDRIVIDGKTYKLSILDEKPTKVKKQRCAIQ